ncbi:unnamed protein product, partial [Hapterophycus canaliculatus]
CIETPCERYKTAAFGEGEACLSSTARRNGFAGNFSGNSSGGKMRYTSARGETRDETVRTFALWMLAHYTSRPDDRVHVASHGGLKVLTSVLMGPTGLVESAKACGEGQRPALRQKFINLKLAAKALANLCQQAPQNAELIQPAGVLAAIEALYAFATNDKDGSCSRTSVYSRAQRNCVPMRYRIEPDFRKTYLVIQENLWRPIVKIPVIHEDGTVTVHYEVPAGRNECLELSKRVTPMDIGRRELQICRGEVSHQINVLAEVAACLSALAMHSSVLKLFALSEVLGPFLQLSLEQLIPRETCLTALLNTPVHDHSLSSIRQHSQRPRVMQHVWSLITSIVLESEQDLCADCGDSVGSEDGNKDAEGIEDAEESTEQDPAGRGGTPKNAGSETRRRQKRQAERAAWSSRVVQQKLEQALAVRVLDRLVAGADEDAFESSRTSTSEDDGA